MRIMIRHSKRFLIQRWVSLYPRTLSLGAWLSVLEFVFTDASLLQ